MSINEAGILLIRPSPVKKFWTLDTKEDGEYWIDPEKSENPLRVCFDMSRYGGETQGL